VKLVSPTTPTAATARILRARISAPAPRSMGLSGHYRRSALTHGEAMSADEDDRCVRIDRTR